jgi:uncharacterized protein (TIGR03085 family)
MTITGEERRQLCDTFEAVGPDAPTLCAGWNSRDLLAHLLVRERRPDAAAGIAVPFLAKHTAHVMAGYADTPWSDMIGQFRRGAPLWSVFGLPVVGDWANLFEFYVHHEDVRRAQQHWEPRPENPALDDAVFARLKLIARLLFRKTPVGVVLRSAGRDDVVARKREPSVVLVGLPSELALISYGRPNDRARVVIQGEPDVVAAFNASERGL